MTTNPLRQLPGQGQSAWLDELTRDWLADGRLAEMIEADGLRGVTSNPSIFQQAIAASSAYDAQLRRLAARGLDAGAIYDALTLDDIRAACDVFLPLYQSTDGRDGLVSHEVSPDLAHDTWGTIREARRLWEAIGRPNAMIKIPATLEGLPAIQQCLEDGINVNVTLMFSLAHYDAVAEVYLRAMEARLAAGLPLDRIASVASFFVSRVDTHVDALLDARMQASGDPTETRRMRQLRGTAAVANAKRAYRRYREVFSGARYAALERHGAPTQRVLWASTSSKDPAFRDVKYVEELIGPHTVNTLPLATVVAFRDHGRVEPTLTRDLPAADAAVSGLGALGIDLGEVGEVLLRQGVARFAAALGGMLETLEARRVQVLADASRPPAAERASG